MLIVYLLAVAALAPCLSVARAVGQVGSNLPLCASFQPPNVQGAQVVSIESKELRNATISAFPPLLNNDVTGLNVCEVDVILTHPGADDRVRVQVWLPMSSWNGRFLAIGGSAYAAGTLEYSLAPVAALGYAAAST